MRMTQTGCRWLLALALCISSPLLQAEIYQWRDAQGKLHFSDKRPPSQTSEEISGQLAPLNIDESAIEQSRLDQVFRGETPEEKQWRQNKEAEAGRLRRQQEEAQQERCDEMRRHLSALRGPIYYEREDGSTYTISVAEQKQRIIELEAGIAEQCEAI